MAAEPLVCSLQINPLCGNPFPLPTSSSCYFCHWVMPWTGNRSLSTEMRDVEILRSPRGQQHPTLPRRSLVLLLVGFGRACTSEVGSQSACERSRKASLQKAVVWDGHSSLPSFPAEGVSLVVILRCFEPEIKWTLSGLTRSLVTPSATRGCS